MRNKNSKDRLYLFIIISLVIHLGLFYFVPWGGFATGINPEGRTMEEFEFIQFIDFEEIPQEGQDIEMEEELSTEKTQEKELSEQDQETESEVETEEVSEEEMEEKEDLVDKQEESTETAIKEEEIPEEQQEEILTSEEAEEEIDTESEPEEDTVQVEEAIETQQEEELTEEEVSDDQQEQVEGESEEPEDTTPPPAGELVLTSQEPVYPKYSVGPGETGEVIISAKINIDGEIIEVSISESSGVESMDLNAKNTIEHGWDFNSYSRPYTMDIFVSFDLDERGDPIIDYELLELKLD